MVPKLQSLRQFEARDVRHFEIDPSIKLENIGKTSIIFSLYFIWTVQR
jgi:hypothetical protein